MTKPEREAEIRRRRDARLGVAGPGTFALEVRAELSRLGALWDARFKQWVLPDEEALARAREAADCGLTTWARDVVARRHDDVR